MENLDGELKNNLDFSDNGEMEKIYCSREDLVLQQDHHRKRDYHDEHISNLRKNGHLRKPRIYKWDKDL